MYKEKLLNDKIIDFFTIIYGNSNLNDRYNLSYATRTANETFLKFSFINDTLLYTDNTIM